MYETVVPKMIFPLHHGDSFILFSLLSSLNNLHDHDIPCKVLTACCCFKSLHGMLPEGIFGYVVEKYILLGYNNSCAYTRGWYPLHNYPTSTVTLLDNYNFK